MSCHPWQQRRCHNWSGLLLTRPLKEDRCLVLVSELELITLLDGKMRSLGSAARDTFTIFEDLRLLGDIERLQPLKLEYLCKMFSLLVESIFSNFSLQQGTCFFPSHSVLLKMLSLACSAGFTLPFLLKLLSAELTTVSESFLVLLKLVTR